jgi:hypothetical protein
MVIPQFSSKSALNYAPMVSSKSVGSQSTTNFNSLLNPSTLSEFNCFIVFVGGSGFDSGGSCSVSDGTSFKLGGFAGGMKSGEIVEMNVPSGSDREIVLVGFKTEDVSLCKDFHGGLPQSALSEPFVVARQTKSLSSGTVSVDLSPSSMTAKISDCQFASDNGGGGAYYGNGSDGDLTVSGTMYMSTMTSPAGPYYTSSSAVTAITDLGNGTAEITVASPWNMSSYNNFKMGDEMMLYVVGGSEGTPNGCGEVFPGFSMSGIVTFAQTGSTTGKTFRMTMTDSRWLHISPTNLTATASGSTPQTFCRVVARRVPHFNNIDLTAGDLSVYISSSGSTDMTDSMMYNFGVLPVRVKNQILIPSATTLIWDVSGRGYLGGNPTDSVGQSHLGKVTGWSTISNPLGAGGGYDSNIACGGGHGGQGGCPTSSTLGGQPVGDQYGCNVLDPTMSCLRGKFFMGGGGAGDSSQGGAGGGAIRLLAKSIVNDGTMTIWATGGAGSSLDDGGGAGGSIYVAADSVSGTGGFNFNAAGGNGGASSGGVGGGGRVHVTFKSSTFSGSSSFTVGKGSSGANVGAQAGTCLAYGINLSGCTAGGTPP